ncbi:hydrolase [Paenarthrobacter sp. PH39-S1]|uniref:hydrolase n=1 Tax=Paenarthrobacter sp. PH39-S1 TaxID=3046204 RepID=UPI0024B8B901|nr:hydrolase [Paenarthrobacter sp. PH39-S1]MDJ0354828.1 hydrolase [Paenarthrobacter sp. PH39-S1]
MTIWTCATCAIEHPCTPIPPQLCEICTDERQYVPASGQRWTTREELAAAGHQITVRELEPDLYAVECVPEFGIGQRGLLLRTAHGNLLWEPPGFIDDAGIAAIRTLGGITVITASHPHLTGSSIQWSHAFGSVPVYVAAADKTWIRRPDPVIQLWDTALELLPGVRMIPCGGHFAGSSIVHWRDGAAGQGAILTGDTIGIGADRASVNVMRSYVNNIPLPERAVRKILDTVMPLPFDRIYSAFRAVGSGSRPIVDWSLQRYISWIRGEVEE